MKNSKWLCFEDEEQFEKKKKIESICHSQARNKGERVWGTNHPSPPENLYENFEIDKISNGF